MEKEKIKKKSGTITIAALPQELLAAIFFDLTEYRSIKWQPPPTNQAYNSDYEWTVAMLVCRSWRDAILSTPWLWSFVSGTYDLQTIQRLLKRSRSASLVVEIIIREHITLASTKYKLILSQLCRIERLRVECGPKDDYAEVVALILACRAPRLRELAFCYLDRKRANLSASTFAHVPMLDPTNLPLLKIVELYGCQSDWSSLVLRGLTKLSLIGCSPISSNQLLSVLEGCPQLRELCLTEPCLDCLSDPSTRRPVRPVSLPALASLQLVASYDACLFVLRSCRFPALFDWNFCCISRPALALPNVDFFPVPDDSVSFASANIQLSVSGHRIGMRGHLKTASGKQYVHTAMMAVGARGNSVVWPAAIDVAKIIRRGRWEHCEALRVEVQASSLCGVVHAIPFKALCVALPALRGLRLQLSNHSRFPMASNEWPVECIMDLLNALVQPLEPRTDEARDGTRALEANVLCQRLQVLRLDMPPDKKLDFSSVWAHLLSCLIGRDLAGRRLKRLQLGFFIRKREAQLTELGKYVDELLVDEEEILAAA